MLRNLEVVTNNLPLVDTDSVLITNLPSFTIEIRKVNKANFQGETFEIGSKEESQRQKQATGDVAASISVPSGLLEGAGELGDGVVAVSSIYHRTTSLFVQEAGNSNVGTSVISATLANNGSEVTVKNLSSPVLIRFKKVRSRFMILIIIFNFTSLRSKVG